MILGKSFLSSLMNRQTLKIQHYFVAFSIMLCVTSWGRSNIFLQAHTSHLFLDDTDDNGVLLFWSWGFLSLGFSTSFVITRHFLKYDPFKMSTMSDMLDMYLGRRSESFPLTFRALKFLSQSCTELRCFSINFSTSTWPNTTHSCNAYAHTITVSVPQRHIFQFQKCRSRVTDRVQQGVNN